MKLLKNSILYNVYLKRLIPLIILYLVMLFIATDEIVFHYNGESLIYIIMIAMTGAVLFYMIRSPKDHNFINALPVTKKEQWKAMYLALITMIGIVYVFYILITFIRLKSDVNTFTDIFFSGIVKGFTAVLATNLVLWVFSHTDFRFPLKLIIGLVLILYGLPAVGSLIQKAFNNGCNNFVYEIITGWNVMTIPSEIFLQNIEEFVGEKYSIIYKRMLELKPVIIGVYILATGIMSAILFVLAHKNYEKLDFAKSQKEGNIKNFSPIVISLFVMVSVMGVFSRAVQLADLIRLDVTSTRSSWYEGPIYEDYFSDRDVEMVMAKRNGEVYYVVVEYSSMNHENAVQNYISYKYEFPDDYRSYFIVGVAVSVISGILIATAPRLIRKG